MRAAVALLVLALTPMASGDPVVENPRFRSPNGEFCVVVRLFAHIADLSPR